MSLIPEHLVQIEDRTAGVHVRCHTCPLDVTLDLGVGRPLNPDEFAHARSLALAVRDVHQHPALRFGVVDYRG